ncbi:MAG: hypothetical protein HC855_06950 [Rhizobiales bacterium]|nr:hypothetical protein [Hyphomicrobiales bacterium]
MRRLLAVLLFAAPATAQSFDCTKAVSVTEKEICKDENADLQERDAAVNRLYGDIQGNPGAGQALSGQSAWIRARDACGAKVQCIRKRYDERIAILARAAGDEGGITGTYEYKLSADTDQGTAFVVRESDGSLSATISTVSGPTFHTCDAGFETAEAIGDAWLYTGAKEDADFEGKICRILVRQQKNAIRIDSLNCTSFCGARGFFDETYMRAE